MRDSFKSRPLVWATATCAAFAALTLFWSASPTYDPYSWLVWSREFAHTSNVPLSTFSPTGWKPLTVFMAIPLVVVPDIEPAIWVWIVRTACLLVLVFAFRLGRRAAGRFGGVGAVVLCIMTPEAFEVFHGGASEGLAALAILYGVESHLERRPGRALSAGLIASLARPEMLGIAAPYGLWAAATKRLAAWKLALGLVVVSLLWIIGDWLGDGGQPLALLNRASRSAEGSAVQAHSHPGLEILVRQQDQLGLAIACVAALALVAAIKWREEVEISLGVVVLAVVVPLAVATELGYPGVPRYLMPVDLVAAVLAGAGLGRLAGLWRPEPMRWLTMALLLLALGALVVPADANRIGGQWDYYAERVRVDRSLPGVIEAAGGRDAVLACGRPLVRPGWLESALAYRLDTTLATSVWHPGKKLTEKRLPSVLFVTRERLERAKGELLSRGMITKQLAASGRWLVVLITTPHGADCRAPNRP